MSSDITTNITDFDPTYCDIFCKRKEWTETSGLELLGPDACWFTSSKIEEDIGAGVLQTKCSVTLGKMIITFPVKNLKWRHEIDEI